MTARMFRGSIGVPAVYLPFSIYGPWAPGELTKMVEPSRSLAEVAPGEMVFVTFGYVHVSKAPEECVWALKMCVTGEFRGVRTLSAPSRKWTRVCPGLCPLVADSELGEHVPLATAMSGADLPGLSVGRRSGSAIPLLQSWRPVRRAVGCAAAGLPTVRTLRLRNDGCGIIFGPIPNLLSPSLLAEALADLLVEGLAAERPEEI